MSAVPDGASLGGFEQRLLVQLRAHVTERRGVAEQLAAPDQLVAPEQQAAPGRPAVAGARRSRRAPRLSLPGAAALAALLTGLLTLLPAAGPTLAQAFPILNGPAQRLPVRLARVLRTGWRAGSAPWFDIDHAYPFGTAAGAGYVVVDQSSRWICILVPGFSPDHPRRRCEQVRFARLGRPPLQLRIAAGRHRQEIVALLPRGAAAFVLPLGGTTRRVTVRSGVLVSTSARPVTVTTTFAGRPASRVTYAP